MIDLHNHILPGVDDGAADLDESLAIARAFVAEGVCAVTATPHQDPMHGRGITGPEVGTRVVALSAALREAGIPLALLPGMELLLTPDAPGLLQAGTACGLAGSSWVLVELPPTTIERPLYLDDTLFHLQLAGYRPILAHPERYGFVQRDPGTLDALVDRGAVAQVTAPALLGEYGRTIRKTAAQLVRNGSCALAASDRHHPGPARSLARLHAVISTIASPQTADLMLSLNPSRVLQNEELEPPSPSERRKRRFGFLVGGGT